MFELRLVYNYIKGIKIVPRLKVSMPSYNPEQAFVNKFYANLEKQVYNGNTDRIWAIPEPVSYCFKWVGMMRLLNWNTFMKATHWWQLLQVLAGRTGSSWRKSLLASVGEGPVPREISLEALHGWCAHQRVSARMDLGLWWQAGHTAGDVSEEPLPLSTGFRCQNCISLHLELLFVQDLGCPYTPPSMDQNLYTCSRWAFWPDL